MVFGVSMAGFSIFKKGSFTNRIIINFLLVILPKLTDLSFVPRVIGSRCWILRDLLCLCSINR